MRCTLPAPRSDVDHEPFSTSVFRIRLGKALNFDFLEDWQGGLFSRAEPRSAGPSLDIERALNKLEKVCFKYKRKHGRPLVVIFNSSSRFHFDPLSIKAYLVPRSDVHLFPNTDEGHALLHQLQQRAEGWAEAGLASLVFGSDDYCKRATPTQRSTTDHGWLILPFSGALRCAPKELFAHEDYLCLSVS